MAYSRTTTNLQLPQYNGSDRASWLDNNTAFLNIDNFAGEQTTKNAELEAGVDGNVESIERLENEIDTQQTEQSAQGTRISGLESLTEQHSSSISKLNGDVSGLTDSVSALSTRVGANETAISALSNQTALNTDNINANKIIYNNNTVDIGISPIPPSTYGNITRGTLTINGDNVVDIKLNAYGGSASAITITHSSDNTVVYNGICTRVNVDNFLNELKKGVNRILAGGTTNNYSTTVSLDYGCVNVRTQSSDARVTVGTWICILPKVEVTLSNPQYVDDAVTIDYVITTRFAEMSPPIKNTSTSDIIIDGLPYNNFGLNPVNASNIYRIDLDISIITQGV